MLLVRPVILVTDESCQSWYSNLQNNDITSLRWHVSFTSPSSDCMKTWKGICFFFVFLFPLDMVWPWRLQFHPLHFTIFQFPLFFGPPVLTTEILKEHSVTSVPLNYRFASEGAVVICFTSGIYIFNLSSSFFLFMFNLVVRRKNYEEFSKKSLQDISM